MVELLDVELAEVERLNCWMLSLQKLLVVANVDVV